MRRRKIVGIGTVVVVLFVFGFSQLQAQSSLTLEGLSGRITTLTRMVSTLTRNKADRSEVGALETRVSALEATLEDTRPDPTATRRRPTSTPTHRPPTSTPTRVRPTTTPTPAKPHISITRNMNVRRGPGTNYVVLGQAAVGEKFDINGKNAAGTWWRISFDGKNAWIYAPYVTATNAGAVPVVPFLAPLPTATPRPATDSIVEFDENADEVDYAVMLAVQDRQRADLFREWSNQSQESRNAIIAGTVVLLILTSEYCGMSISAVALMIDEHAQYLDDSGYTTRNDVRARAFLMYALTKAEEATRSPVGCDSWLRIGVRNLLASE